MYRVYLLAVLLSLFSAGLIGEEVKIKDINSDKLNSSVTVEGTILNLLKPSANSPNFVLYVTGEDGNSIRVVIPAAIAPQIKSKHTELKGVKTKCTGTVKQLLSYYELWVNSPADVWFEGDIQQQQSIPVSPSAPQPAPHYAQQPAVNSGAAASVTNDIIISDFSQITADLENKPFTITGTVAEFTKSWKETAPSIITLTDGKNKFKVVYWKDVEPNVPESQKTVGAVLQVKGVGYAYNKVMQIKVLNANDITLVMSSSPKSAASSTSALSSNPFGQMSSSQPTVKSGVQSAMQPDDQQGSQAVVSVVISSIDKNKEGSIVKIEGTVDKYTHTWSANAPCKILLKDNTGTINVVYWKDVYQNLSRQPSIGDKMSVVGIINVYKSDLQVKVDKPENILFSN